MSMFSALEAQTTVNDLPLFTEMAIDFTTGEPIYKDNEIVVLTGIEALKVWVWKALHTDKNVYKSYSKYYGNNLKDQIGFVYDRTIKDQLMTSDIYDCLTYNPYITNVYDFEITTRENGTTVDINFKFDSIYGSATQEVLNVW